MHKNRVSELRNDLLEANFFQFASVSTEL